MGDQEMMVSRPVSTAVRGAIAGAMLLAVVALIWCFGLNNHLSAAEKELAAAQKTNAQQAQRLDELGARLRATSETLGQSVGLTQKQIELRTESLVAAQQAAAKAQAAQTAKLEQAQAATEKQVGAVATDVSTVKTDVGGAKASIAETQNDLQATKAQLQRTMGDAGVMSGLIARTHDELEELKHRGDRNYYEFTLRKGAPPTLLSTIKVQAKKVDDKHAKYTLMVSADDRNIEKKDKSLDEPVQFYSGKDPVLFEIVVNNIAKNEVSGYLSTPKNAPQAMAAPGK
jgi:chromosome segregation ATPase